MKIKRTFNKVIVETETKIICKTKRNRKRKCNQCLRIFCYCILVKIIELITYQLLTVVTFRLTLWMH